MTGILELVAVQRSGVSLNEINEHIDAPRTSVYDLVQGLTATGYLEKSERGTYVLGPAVAALLLPSGTALRRAALPLLAELRRRFDETVLLATRVGDSMVFVEAAESTQSIRYHAPIGSRRPLWPTSAGKCLLAYAAQRQREAYVRLRLPASERAAALSELETVRTEGVGYNRGETVPELYAVAAPALVDQRVVACLVIVGPNSRMSDKHAELSDAVREAAGELAAKLR